MKTNAIATPENWVSIQKAATLYECSEKTIRRWIASDLIEARRVGPRLIRVKLSSLEALGFRLGSGERSA